MKFVSVSVGGEGIRGQGIGKKPGKPDQVMEREEFQDAVHPFGSRIGAVSRDLLQVHVQGT
jgi:hypothetical protein